MNWTYYIITKDSNQFVGYANNFAEAYNQAVEKDIDCYILQGAILTELSAQKPQAEENTNNVE